MRMPWNRIAACMILPTLCIAAAWILSAQFGLSIAIAQTPPGPANDNRLNELSSLEASEKATAEARAPIREKPLCLAGSDSTLRCHEEIIRAFEEQTGLHVEYTGGGTSRGIETLCRNEADIAVAGLNLTESQKKRLHEAFPDPNQQPQEVVFSQSALIFIVHPSNRISGLTLEQLRAVFLGEIKDWSKAGGKAGRISLYGPGRVRSSTSMLRKNVLKMRVFSADGIVFLGRDDAVIDKVSRDPKAIAYLLAPADAEFKGVRAIPVAVGDNSPAVAPTREHVLTEEYPLVQKVTLLVHPNAPDSAMAYCRFACSEAVVDIAHKWGFFPVVRRRQAFARKRLSALEASEGTRVLAIGIPSGQRLMDDQVVEYVKAEAVMQMRYSPREESAAVGYFVADAGGHTVGVGGKQSETAHCGPELLLLDSLPSKEALKIHGSKWDQLKPRQRLLGGRAAAIVVHNLNQLDAISLDQVRAVFSAKIKDWKHLAATGEETKPIRIQPLGLARPNAAANLFYAKVLPPHVCGPMIRKKTVGEILAAMATAPQSIAFVDLAALPPDTDGDGVLDGTSVKVLAIRPSGMNSTAVAPNARTIADGSYPLSQRLWLYVHPDASATAKDFAEFMATCGHSEDSPYLETVRSVAETFRAHGVVPAAEAQPEAPCSPSAVELQPTSQPTDQAPIKAAVN